MRVVEIKIKNSRNNVKFLKTTTKIVEIATNKIFKLFDKYALNNVDNSIIFQMKFQS